MSSTHEITRSYTGKGKTATLKVSSGTNPLRVLKSTSRLRILQENGKTSRVLARAKKRLHYISLTVTTIEVVNLKLLTQKTGMEIGISY